METENNNSNNETLHNNTQLFSLISENIPPDEKLKKILKYQGADVNAIDTTNGNTLLHVAAIEGEIEVVGPLIEKGADVTIQNIDNKTVSDISQHIDIPKNTKLTNIMTTAQPLLYVKDQENTTYCYQKRSGTAGICGQLYETKLLSLILLRALFDNNIKEFVMGTNIEGIGALDDIVLRYETHDTQTPKMLFLQAKHKDNPTRDKLTVGELLKTNGDFCLHKYLDSYMKIKQRFATDNDDPMFQGSMKDIELTLVIYTPANENFAKKKILCYTDEEKLISTGEEAKTFQFKYDNNDIDCLLSTVIRSRAKQLANSLSKFLLTDNFNSMMADDLIKTYHVYLAQQVIAIDNTATETAELLPDGANNTSNQNYNTGTFRQSFLNSKDNILSFLKQALRREIADLKGCQSNEAETMLELLSFKLPLGFGNQYFCFNCRAKKREKRLVYLCSLFEKLFEKFDNNATKYIFIKLDEDSVGPNGIVHSADVQIRLADLVGNFLVNDDETDMLKFNLNECSLSHDNILILHRLKLNKQYDLDKYRFDINYNKFPVLTLNCKEYDLKLVTDFLRHLKFYTNQAKEDEVESILKKEIQNVYRVQQHHDFLFHFKCNAIYLKVHDEMQKWWKQSNSAPYLTKTSQLYQQADEAISDIPLLNKIHFICSQKMTNNLIEFEAEAVFALKLDWFLSIDERVVLIVSNEVDFSGKKVIQYFDKIKKSNDYIFIDFEVITIEYLEIIIRELQLSIVPVFVVILREGVDAQKVLRKISILTKLYKGKIIIISKQDHGNKLQITNVKYVIHIDNMNSFRNLSQDVRKLILEERKFIFLGLEVNVNTVLDDTSLSLLSPNLLNRLINNRQVIIGTSLLNSSYESTIGYYVSRSVCRYITLDLNKYVSFFKRENKPLFFATGLNTEWTPPDDSDLLLLTHSEKVIEETCKSNSKCNIHWFRENDQDFLIWNKSYGNLRTLFNHTERGTHDNYSLLLTTLKDIDQKVVIISAEPGMGKSTLLTHLAINTIRMYPTLWVMRINLLDYTYKFNMWKDEKAAITLTKVIELFYNTLMTKDYKTSDYDISEITKYVFVDENNAICLDEKGVGQTDLDRLDLSEIKLFNHFYNKNSLAILFDGFDEICPDYMSEVIQLFSTLKTSKVAHLFVTSRPYCVLNQLEISLGTFSFHLKPFTIDEQKTYLHNVWSQRLGFDISFEYFRTYLSNFYTCIATILGDTEGKFMSLPLHLYMITEIYQSYFKDYIDLNKHKLPDKYFEDIKVSSNLITLYEKFTNMKFVKIRFGEKKLTMNQNDPDIRKMVELEWRMFEENHKKIAAFSLLDRSIVLTENEIKDVYDFIESVKAGDEKTGIVLNIVENEPKFVHNTFAEYFATEFIFDKLLKSTDRCSSLWLYIIDNILTGDKYGIRRFINGKLQREQVFTYLMSYLSDFTFDIMLAQNILPTTALSIAIAEYLEDNSIAKFLLKCIITKICKDNLPTLFKLIHKNCERSCVFCIAIQIRNYYFVKSVIKLVTDVDQTKLKDLFYCAGSPFLLVLYSYDKEIYRIIFEALQHDTKLLVDLFTFKHKRGIQITAAHSLGESGLPMLYFNEYLKKLSIENRVQIFNVKDNDGQLPIHYAARNNDYGFIYTMDVLLGKKHFKRMCLHRDKEGFTPICRLPYSKFFFKELKNVIMRVYGDVYTDVEDFAFNHLPKLHPKRVEEHLPLFCDKVFRLTPGETDIVVGNVKLLKDSGDFDDVLNKNDKVMLIRAIARNAEWDQFKPTDRSKT